MKGLVFSVKRYAVHDGPGIRVTFFFKGCHLNCRWCHNPEGISPLPEDLICNDKVGDRLFQVTKTAGNYYSVDEILEILDRERIFLNRSGGGVTFSGGEPMDQPEFLAEVLMACKQEGYSTAVDTSGYAEADRFRLINPFTDLFLFDIKHLDEYRHIEHTGVSNSVILDNYQLLLEIAKEIWVRIPIIPGFNDDSRYLEELKQFLISTKRESLTGIYLLPYHRIGSSKYTRLNVSCKMHNVSAPSKEKMKELTDFFCDTGVKVKIGG
jgi:pyruvate formate lyase activating enzyme